MVPHFSAKYLSLFFDNAPGLLPYMPREGAQKSEIESSRCEQNCPPFFVTFAIMKTICWSTFLFSITAVSAFSVGRTPVSTTALSAKKKAAPDDGSVDPAKRAALDGVLNQIERSYGRGSIVKLGDADNMIVDSISSGALTLDAALGGGFPKGRVIEIYGPPSPNVNERVAQQPSLMLSMLWILRMVCIVRQMEEGERLLGLQNLTFSIIRANSWTLGCQSG